MMILGFLAASSCTLILAYGEREQNYFFSAPAQNPYLRGDCRMPSTENLVEDRRFRRSIIRRALFLAM